MAQGCIFCRIIAGEISALRVHENEHCLVFLDIEPLFPGHCLVCPKQHYETMLDLPPELIEPVFGTAQLVGRAVERGMEAEGVFVAANVRVSQSVPHLHVHVVPRRRKDGLRGFFWPKNLYRDEEHKQETVVKLQKAIAEMKPAG